MRRGIAGKAVSQEDVLQIEAFIEWLEINYVEPARLLKVFKDKKISGVELARVTGLSEAQCSYFKNGKFKPIGINSIIAISNALSIVPQEGDLPPSNIRNNLAPPLRLIDAAAPPRIWTERNAGETDIIAEKSEAAHQYVIGLLINRLAELGKSAKDSILIDLSFEHEDGLYIFEVKSISDNYSNELDQIRAGFAQLKEYKFRYRDHNVTGLCLALSRKPSLKWISAFLINEGIDVIFVNMNELYGVCPVPGFTK